MQGRYISEDDAELSRSADTFVDTVNVLESLLLGGLGSTESRVSSTELLIVRVSKRKQSEAVSNKNAHCSCLDQYTK